MQDRLVRRGHPGAACVPYLPATRAWLPHLHAMRALRSDKLAGTARVSLEIPGGLR